MRDYRIRTSTGEVLTGGAAFNIKTESLRMGDFSPDEIAELYAQYTAESGHAIAPDVIDRVWELTRGQPWLVSALAREALEKAKPNRAVPATVADFEAAKERPVLARVTHLDQLTFRLKEERVRRVIEPILAGEEDTGAIDPGDLEYLVDLGLLRRERNGRVAVANGIYREVIPRELIWAAQSL